MGKERGGGCNAEGEDKGGSVSFAWRYTRDSTRQEGAVRRVFCAEVRRTNKQCGEGWNGGSDKRWRGWAVVENVTLARKCYSRHSAECSGPLRCCSFSFPLSTSVPGAFHFGLLCSEPCAALVGDSR